MHTTSHIAQRLLTTYDDMPRGERKLADLLLEDVGVVGHLTSADLAAQAGVSKATAARLFRRSAGMRPRSLAPHRPRLQQCLRATQ